MDPRKIGHNLSVKTAQDLTSRMDDQRSKVFKFGSQWLNVVPRKNLGLKLVDQQLRLSFSVHLEANICVANTCLCGEKVERDGLKGLYFRFLYVIIIPTLLGLWFFFLN